MAAKRPTCRVCGYEHWSYEPHKLMGGPEPSKDVKRLARPAVSKTIRSRAQAVILERTITTAPVDLATAYDGVGPLTPENARLLTDGLKAQLADVLDQAEVIGRALELAERRDAWKALGYPTWGAYLDAEFKGTRQRAHQILAFRRFVAALPEGPVTSEPDTVVNRGLHDLPTERATREIRNNPELVEKVKRIVVQGVSPKDAVDRVRRALPAKASGRTPDPATGQPCDHEPLTVVVCKNCGKRLE